MCHKGNDYLSGRVLWTGKHGWQVVERMSRARMDDFPILNSSNCSEKGIFKPKCLVYACEQADFIFPSILTTHNLPLNMKVFSIHFYYIYPTMYIIFYIYILLFAWIHIWAHDVNILFPNFQLILNHACKRPLPLYYLSSCISIISAGHFPKD